MNSDRLAITEEILLLLLDGEDGAPAVTPPMSLEHALAGAVLIDLMLRQRIEIEHEHVRLVDWEPTGLAFLDRSLRNLHAGGEPRRIVDWIPSIAEDASEIKHAAFESLVRRNVLDVEETPLVPDFSAHRYRGVESAADDQKHDRLLDSLVSGEKLGTSDLTTIGLANACGLFEIVLGKKKRRSLRAKIEQAAPVDSKIEPVLRSVELLCRSQATDSPSMADAKTSRSRDAPRTNNWEWRAFWTEDTPVFAPASTLARRPTEDYKRTRVTDRYLLVPERRDNIKVRKNGLEVKQQIETYRQFQAFRPKQVFKFPIRADGMTEIFPRMYGLEEEIGDLDALEAVLKRFDYRPRWLETTKTRYRLRVDDDSQIEFCTFEAAGRHFRSACIEGPDHARVLALVHSVNPRSARVMGYIDFLHRVSAGSD